MKRFAYLVGGRGVTSQLSRNLGPRRASAESEIEDVAGNLPVLNGVELKMVWTFSGVPQALNILHFNNAQGATITQSVANQVDTAVKSALTSSGHLASLHTGTALARCDIRSMTSNTDPWFLGAGAPVAGTSTGDPLPAATALVVTSVTGLRGRSFMGRTYLWGWAEGVNDAAGGVTVAAANAAAQFLTSVRTALAGQTPSFTQAILSRWTTPPGGVVTERNPPILTTVVQNLCKDQRWDTQRRRAIPGI